MRMYNRLVCVLSFSPVLSLYIYSQDIPDKPQLDSSIFPNLVELSIEFISPIVHVSHLNIVLELLCSFYSRQLREVQIYMNETITREGMHLWEKLDKWLYDLPSLEKILIIHRGWTTPDFDKLLPWCAEDNILVVPELPGFDDFDGYMK